MKIVIEVDKSRRAVGSKSSNHEYDDEHEDWMIKGPGDILYGD